MAERAEFIHCRTCVERRQTERLEVGFTETGLLVVCKKHGLVVHLTPEMLADLLKNRPVCDMCARREPHVH